jgi:DNA-binding SARP family transcriptional activator
VASGQRAVASVEREAGRAETAAPSVFALRLLRSFELVRAGEPLELPLSAQRLLAFLALREHPLSRVHVAGVLWPEATQEHANASLRTALWRLHRVGVELVIATSTSVLLAGDVAVDVRETNRRARRILDGGGAVDGDTGQLSQAGELLPDWYDDWVLIERERVRQLCVNALELASAEATAAGRTAQATDAALAAVSFEPLRESAHRAVIAAHLAAGNFSEALRQYRLCRRLLGAIGLEPSPLMREQMRALRIGDDRVT